MSSHLSNEELLGRIEALEEKVRKSNLMMRRPGHQEYEKLVDIVCDHEIRLSDHQKSSERVSELSEIDDTNW